jgi:hypothetical protein
MSSSGPTEDPDLAVRIGGALIGLAGSLFPVLPVIAGLSVGVTTIERGLVSTALKVAAVTMLLITAIDLFAPATPPMLNRAVVRGGEVVEMGMPASLSEEGGLRTLAALVGGGIPGAEEITRPYPAGHPRLRAMRGLFALLYLLLPFPFVGINLGAGSWLSSRATFHLEKDERLARLILSWAGVPLLFFVIQFLSVRIQAAVLFQGSSLFLVLSPTVPLFILAWFGWKAAKEGEDRASRMDPAFPRAA